MSEIEAVKYIEFLEKLSCIFFDIPHGTQLTIAMFNIRRQNFK